MSVNHSENIISVSDASFSYGENEVFKDIQLNVHRGDYLAIVGGNGSGKTTLLDTILGLRPLSSGSIALFGVALGDFKEWKRIGYVPQKVTNFDQNFPATVEEVALMGRFGRRGLFRNTTKEDRAKVEEALARVEMTEYKNRLIGELSGGQQQRVFIARALANDPEILFLDEPTVGIEAAVQEEFYALLKKLNEELSLTIVLVTHDIESIAHEAMHVAYMDKHGLMFHSSVDHFLKTEYVPTHTHHHD